MRRRSVLRAGIVLPLVALAGCSGSPAPPSSPTAEPDGDGAVTPSSSSIPTDEPASTEDDESPAPSTETPDTSTGAATGSAELDLREANVTAVVVSGSEGTFDFDVTLHHDDDGEDGYANWWQVERLDGTRLGRRDLLHAHGTREFTRSASVEIPENVTCVVVRGHDQTHGYGGQVALVNLDSGATRFVGQGPDPRSFSTADCP